jgi:hypothetical protein
MIAAITFPIAGIVAAIHYSAIGPKVGLGLTVWTAWFLAVLLAAGADAARARDRELGLAWAVMAMAWLAALLAWKISADPLIDLTLKNIIVMTLLLIVTRRPETALAVAAHGVVILAAYMAARGVIPSAGQRPRQFIAWSYPDIAAGLQHASLILLGGYSGARSLVLGWRDRRRPVAAARGGPRPARAGAGGLKP